MSNSPAATWLTPRDITGTSGFSSVTLIAGGASATPQETDVVTKKALVGISSPDITGAAITKGAPLKIIGAQYQKNPFAILSLASKPIKTPQDMYGKKIGVQATNESVWSAFVKATKLDESKITKVPVQFDPLPLTQGTVDGWFSFVTNEPNDSAEQGIRGSHAFCWPTSGTRWSARPTWFARTPSTRNATC